MPALADDPAIAGHPIGEPEGWDAEDIALLALLLLSDVRVAGLLWDLLAPRAYRGLLGAVPLADVRAERGALPPIWFDIKTQRYGLGNRGFIPQRAVNAALEAFRANAMRRAVADVALVYAGDLEIGLWQAKTAADLKAVSAVTQAVAVGGIDQVGAAELKAGTKQLKFPIQRLERFAGQIEAGTVTAPAAERRAAMYPETVITAGFDDARRRAHAAVGFKFERNVLDPMADHCLTTKNFPGCPELTDLGWVDIGTMAAPGQRTCIMHCRCHMEFETELPGEK